MSNCSCAFQTHLPSGVSRRDLLKFTAAGAGLAALGPMGNMIPVAHGAPLDIKRAIVINQFGGTDTLNMFVPTDQQVYFDRRPTIAIQPGDGLSLNAGPNAITNYVLNPAMTNIAALWAEGSVAAVQRVGYPSPNLSHFESMNINSYGVRGSFGDLGMNASGWIARYAESAAPTPMGACSVGVGKPLDFVGGGSNPVFFGRLSQFDIEGAGGGSTPDQDHVHRIDQVQKILARYSGSANPTEAKDALEQAHLLASQIQTAVDNYTSGVVYDTGRRLSRQMQDIARIIQGGFETRIFFTGHSGFDTHGGQGNTDGRLYDLLTWLDDAVGSFAQDMKNMGQWNNVVIIIMTEFARRNFENGSQGTDHGHAAAWLVLGGGVNGGSYGPALTDEDLNANWPLHAIDFRSIYKEVVTDHLSGDPALVFPETIPGDVTLGLV